MFDLTSNLGIEGYKKEIYSKPITVEKGAKQNFTIYNANPYGSAVSVRVAFTSAIRSASVIFASLASGLLFYMA